MRQSLHPRHQQINIIPFELRQRHALKTDDGILRIQAFKTFRALPPENRRGGISSKLLRAPIHELESVV